MGRTGTRIKNLIDMKSGMDWDEEDLDLFRECPWGEFLHDWAFGSVENFMLRWTALTLPEGCCSSPASTQRCSRTF